jgi:hypothetical protein
MVRRRSQTQTDSLCPALHSLVGALVAGSCGCWCPCSRAHPRITPWCPPPPRGSPACHLTSSRPRYSVCTRCTAFFLIVWLREHPGVSLGVPIPRNIFTGLLVPWATVRPRPPQLLQVPIMSGLQTRLFVPHAVVLTRPLQHLQVPAPSCSGARPRIPRTALLPRPLQHLQVPAPSGKRYASSRSMDSHAPTPIAAHPDSRPERRVD